jgi:hypothetical protein
MKVVGIVGGLNWQYVQIKKELDWMKHLPNGNWMCIAIADNNEKKIVETVINACINNNAMLVCCAGNAAEELEDAFEWECISRDIADDSRGAQLITTLHDTLPKAVDYMLGTSTSNNPKPTHIVCIDMTDKGYGSKLQLLLTDKTDVINQ